MNKGACWKSDLDLHHQDDETESQSSTAENYGDPKETPVGPLMLHLFENQQYTDVEFTFKNTGDRLCAHRVVLAAKCQFFADLLFGAKVDSIRGMKMGVDISNVPFPVFRDIVNYFYTDDIYFPDLSTVLDIHTTAESFKIQSLINLCEQYLGELELTEDNACSTLQISNSKCANSLKKRCLHYIRNHALEVISSPDFEKCSFTTVHEISNLQDLNLRSESEMLEAVTRWINVQPDHAKADLRKSLMKCIRFLSFTPKEFHGVIKQHPELLTSGEALDTLIYLNDPTTKNMEGLPDWMNKSCRTFSLGEITIGLADIKVENAGGKIEIPLTTAPAQVQLDRLISFLQMKCLKGDHKINGITIKLEDITNEGGMLSVVVVKAIVMEKSHNVFFSKTIDSKETAIHFHNILVSSGQTLHLEVEIIACKSCKFFQYDGSKEGALSNEYFECSVASRPKQGRFYFIQKVLFGSRKTVQMAVKEVQKSQKTVQKSQKTVQKAQKTVQKAQKTIQKAQKTVQNKIESPTKVKKTRSRRRKAKQTQAETESFGEMYPSTSSVN